MEPMQRRYGFSNVCFPYYFLFGPIRWPSLPQVKLEEKQRARRRKREAMATKAAEAAAAGNMEEAERLKKASSISPYWFSKEYDACTNTMMHIYKGGYWEAKASKSWDHLNLPDIF